MALETAFLLSLTLLMAGLVYWAFKRLPEEHWQFLASVPVVKDASGRWHGLNFTYYGLLTANAVAFGVAILIVLFSAVGIGIKLTIALVIAMLLICVPSARWVARLVEGKQCTFTIAGAFFVGILVAPALMLGLNYLVARTGVLPVPVMPAMAALMIAYAFGEGLGRLACISFGCCYGVSLRHTTPRLRRFFSKRHFVFRGQMKKISYASGMEGEEVVPIQALTCVFYILSGLAATVLFLRGSFDMALLGTMAVTQGWRSLSETLRADYRGDRKVSVYQVMGILAIFLAAALVFFEPASAAVVPDLAAGLASLWQPTLVISLQALWAIVFVIFGKSMVTRAEISFHIHYDRI
jgi:hypothetical protein